MRNLTQDNITQAVIARLARTPDPRLREVMTSLVQHLHAFVRDVKLTESEWSQGIRFLTEVGRKTDDKRQEFVLLSDTLGLSMLTVAMNNEKPAGCTEATVAATFPGEGAPCVVRGRVVALGGEPVAGATIDVWPAGGGERSSVRCGPDGRFEFPAVLAKSCPIPDDGPVGELLRATARHPWRPAHLHCMVIADGYERLVTHVFRSGDQYLDSDAVFGVRESLVAHWARQADGSDVLEYDFVLNPKAIAKAGP